MSLCNFACSYGQANARYPCLWNREYRKCKFINPLLFRSVLYKIIVSYNQSLWTTMNWVSSTGVGSAETYNFSTFDRLKFVHSSSRSNLNKLRYKNQHTSVYYHFYFTRIVHLWNSLPPTDLSQSIVFLKPTIKNYLWNQFITNFKSNKACSFPCKCPCSSCHITWLIKLLFNFISCNNQYLFCFHNWASS